MQLLNASKAVVKAADGSDDSGKDSDADAKDGDAFSSVLISEKNRYRYRILVRNFRCEAGELGRTHNDD